MGEGGRVSLLRRSFSAVTAAAAAVAASININAAVGVLRAGAARLLTLSTAIIAHFSTFSCLVCFSAA